MFSKISRMHVCVVYAQKHNGQASPSFECDYVGSHCNITQVESVQSAHSKMVPNIAWAQYYILFQAITRVALIGTG